MVSRIRQTFESNKKWEKNSKTRAKSNLVHSKDLTFHKYHNIDEFARRSFYLRQNTFYYDTKEIRTNNEALEKDLEKRKFMINTASKLYDKLLNIYATH